MCTSSNNVSITQTSFYVLHGFNSFKIWKASSTTSGQYRAQGADADIALTIAIGWLSGFLSWLVSANDS